MVDDARNTWESEAIEKWPLAKLRGYKGNARIHDRASIDAIKKSIIEFGFVTPLLIDETGEIICGHGRAQAAAELGIIRVPVIVARGWSEARIAAYRISDNATAERSTWNFELLKVEIGDLAKLDFPIEVLGFPDIQLAAFVAGFGGGQQPAQAPDNQTLAEQFGVPPFSVLNARTGWWQLRKAAWIGLGMQPELGRGDASTPNMLGPESRRGWAAEQERYHREGTRGEKPYGPQK
jgi:ParB-like nuclease family protein